jgi:hypothetical protein
MQNYKKPHPGSTYLNSKIHRILESKYLTYEYYGSPTVYFRLILLESVYMFMLSRSRSHVTTDGQSVSQSVCQGTEPTLRLVTRYYFLSEGCFLKAAVLSLWNALSDERSHLSLSVYSNLSVFTSSIYVRCVLQFSSLYTIYIKLHSVPSQYRRLCSTDYYYYYYYY